MRARATEQDKPRRLQSAEEARDHDLAELMHVVRRESEALRKLRTMPGRGRLPIRSRVVA